MKIIRNLSEDNIKYLQKYKIIATIGNFDALHKGHQYLFKELKNYQDKINSENENNKIDNKLCKRVIITFFPHSILFFNSNLSHFLINNISEKIRLIIDNDYSDIIIFLKFNKNLANLEAINFINNILIDKINIYHLFIGYDFRFGKNAKGDFNLLQKIFYQNNKLISKIKAQKNDSNLTYSSSSARKEIINGNISNFYNLTNYHFSYRSYIIRGKGLARKLGYKTANLANIKNKILPKFGVYCGYLYFINDKLLSNKKFHFIANFGIKPTFNDNKLAIYEIHILNFNQDIYHKRINIFLTDFIRPEQKFNNIEELKINIAKDIKIARKILNL